MKAGGEKYSENNKILYANLLLWSGHTYIIYFKFIFFSIIDLKK